MTDTRPGLDELRLRSILRKQRVGPDADEKPLPPAQDPDDWFVRLYGPDGTSPIEPATGPDADPEPDPEIEDDEPARTPRERARPRRESPRRALAEAAPNLSPRMRWLALHASAAAAGWLLGLTNWGTNTGGWLAAGHWTDGSAWVVYVLAAMGLALYRRTHRSVLLVAWLGAVPVSSVTLGVLLYGTA
ncbi:hypothetical protein [Streptomyces sp. NPDC055006]